ncbi:DUF1109 domain-containing protein [Sphingomonas sp. AP4-R1]|uniref:DUF1109 domain-containing protein n=1 Tax=Sphingomonas sp. AP4-R1 TaxID=2735134 RepID=UPI00149391C6|nr:DUF1109 domain-containing protein [Sphingomonas sp. AP4-R1]QJU59983.1 DUF1109 domain-containing protein [Sphingomonas sp. AP4-R1]
MGDHDALIDRLSLSVAPVRRLPPAWVRAMGWAVVALPCGLLATGLIRHSWLDWAQPDAWLAAVEILLSFLTGALAVTLAFDSSVAGRPLRGGGWLAVGGLAWLAANMIGIGLSARPLGRIGAGTFCFGFMMLAALPMIGIGILGLRRSPSLNPRWTLAVAGLGIAFMALALLAFCHPVHGNLIDFLAHIVAGVSIVGLTTLCGRRWVAL